MLPPGRVDVACARLCCIKAADLGESRQSLIWTAFWGRGGELLDYRPTPHNPESQQPRRKAARRAGLTRGVP